MPSTVTVIADDFTGGCDAGIQLRALGLTPVVSFAASAGEERWLGGCRILVTDTAARPPPKPSLEQRPQPQPLLRGGMQMPCCI